jgi:hypothetical protein
MSINFNKSELTTLLAFVNPYITSKSPALCLSIQKGHFKLFASENIQGGSVLVSIPLGSKVADRDWLAVDGITLRDLISLTDDGESITLDFDSNALKLSCTRSHAELRFASVWTSPDAVKFGTCNVVIKGKDLNVMATITEAASDDIARPNLQGVFIAPHAGELETAAADGFVLSHVAIKSEQSKDAKGAVYSAEAINRVKRALKPGDDEEINLGIEKSGLTISTQRDKATITLHIPTVTDQFVDYKQLLKIPQSLTIDLPTSTFEKMIKRMKSMGGNVYFQVTGGCFWFMVQSEETGKSIESMPVEVTEESPLMAFQVSTLNDVIKSCAPNGHVTIAFPKNERSPLFFKGQAEALAMPLAHEMKESPFKNFQPALI